MKKISIILIVIVSIVILISFNKKEEIACEQVLLVGKVVAMQINNNIDIQEESICGKIQTSNERIGILTCVDLNSNEFVSMCHGLYSNGELINIENGICYQTSKVVINKSENGKVGSISAVINNDKKIGDLDNNNHKGVFGTATNVEEIYSKDRIYEVASKSEIKLGKAEILVDLYGDGVKSYDVEIYDINYFNNSQNIFMNIIDENLLNETGGIVKGMSGSPIVQNEKFIGAINYGAEDDYTKCCAIFAENLIK